MPLLWCCYAGCSGEKHDYMMSKNFFDNGCGSMGSMILKGRNKVRKGGKPRKQGNRDEGGTYFSPCYQSMKPVESTETVLLSIS